MNQRIKFLLGILILFLFVAGCSNNPSTSNSRKTYKIALLQLGTHPLIDLTITSFEKRINQLYGENAEIIKYNSNFDMATGSILANQMTASKADILVSVTTPSSGQLIGANRGTLPLVFTFVSDPKAIGYTIHGSLKNTTGLSDQVNYRQTLRMIRLFKPTAKKIGYILTRSEPNAVTIYEGFQSIASEEGFSLITATIGGSADVRMAAENLATNVDLFLFGGDNNVATSIDALINVAKSNGLPIFACDEESVERGALAAYSVDYRTMGKQTADISAMILGGINPENIPLEIFSGSRIVVNERMSKILGIEIPLDIKKDAYKIVR